MDITNDKNITEDDDIDTIEHESTEGTPVVDDGQDDKIDQVTNINIDKNESSGGELNEDDININEDTTDKEK